MKTSLLKAAIVAVLISISTNMSAFTAVVSGSWSSPATWGGVGPGATVSNQDVIIPTGITVDLDMDVNFSGLLNSFTVDGSLNSTGNYNVTIAGGTFAGSGAVDIRALRFSGILTAATFSGTLDLAVLQNQGAALTLAASVNVSDTLDLDAGSTILGTGSNVSIMNNGNVRVDDGTLTTTGGVFSTTTSYDVWYFGISKTTGLEVNSSNLTDLHINLNNNNQILTQGLNNLVINGVLDMQMGQLDISSGHLTLNGNLVVVAGALINSNATSDITVMGSGQMTDDFMFTSGSSVNNFELDRTNGQAKLGSALAVSGTIFLTHGNFVLQSGSTLTMNANSNIQVQNGDFVMNGGNFVGTASYDVDYIGNTHTSGAELWGSGLNDVMVGLASANDTVILDDDVTINGNLDMSMGMLSLDGNDLTLDGTFDQNASAVFVGDSASTMELNITSSNDTIWFGGNMHLDELHLDIGATSTILLASNLTIHNSLDMTSGKIEITNSTITFRPSASINGFSDTRYIVTSGSGQVEMQVVSNSSFVTFPVGTMTEYAPAAIKQTSSGTTGMFRVRTMDNVYAQGTTGFDASTTESVVDKTWVVDAGSAVVVNMNIRFGWEATDEVNGFNRAQSHIAKYNNNAWDTYMNSAATPGANNTYESTRNGATSTGAFAVVDSSAVLGLHTNVITAGVSIYPNPTADVVTVETGDMHANYLYQIYDVTGKMVTSASNANAVNKFDLSAYSNGFYFIKITNTDSNATITKRIVKN